MSEALLKYQVKALSEQMDRIVAERDQLRADNARLRAELNAWNAIPAEELIAYWNAFGNDNDIIGDWVGELRNGINVGRYHAGLEPLGAAVSDLQLVPADKLIDVPGDVAVCPYCGAALFVQCEQWSQQDDGSWAADNVHADCTGEPDVDTPQWEEWLDSHSQMPYVYKLPVDMKVEKWVNEHYRFDLS